jgi:hypothetical protein
MTTIITFSGNNYETTEIENIIFRYDESGEESVERLIEEVSGINDLGNKWFGGSTSSTLTIYLTEADSLLERILGKSNAIFLQNKNIAIINGQLTENEMLHALTHEYAHFHMMTNMIELGMEVAAIPDWFHEGTAEAFAHRFAPIPFNEQIYEWNVVPFSEMKLKGNHSNVGEWYIMSQFTVERLIKNYGEDIILRLLYATKETENFSIGFLNTTKEPLDTYHETLVVDPNFISHVITQFKNEDNWEELERQLLNYDALNSPYYYRAESVYNFLELIYHEQQEWEKALNMLLKQTQYIQSISIWRAASEYAAKIGDEEKVIYYEEKAKEMAELGGSHMDKIFNVE